jgi:hypothetical protein
MTDDIITFADALADFRRERTLQDEFETTEDIVRRINQRVSAERNHFRAAILEMAADEVSDQEVRQRLRRLAENILLRKAAYAEWQKGYRASASFPPRSVP